jgi:hypothetical protein
MYFSLLILFICLFTLCIFSLLILFIYLLPKNPATLSHYIA